jgi:hypothetical protein
MKQRPRKVIHIVKHLPTGAEVPVVIDKMNEKNVIEKYHEHLDNRKGFTLQMLQNRWDMARDDVIELLQEYQVPAHINYKQVQGLPIHMMPIDVAIFFEEYIYGIEKKTRMSHSKLKSRLLHEVTKVH